MPIYEYKCTECGKISEVVVGIAENNAEIKCSQCGSEFMEKIIPSTFIVIEAKKKETISNNTSCCGTTTPCDNPKRCCD